MPNILTAYFSKAADFHLAIGNQGDRRINLLYHRHTRADCERLAAANDNDPDAVIAYQQCEAENAAKLNTARRKVMYTIGKEFRPETPGDVLNEIVREFNAA